MQRNRKDNRMGKTRDLFKKIGFTKGTFHAKIGTIKVKNGKDLTEAEEIKKRWQKYTEVYKKALSVLITFTHSPVLFHRKMSWDGIKPLLTQSNISYFSVKVAKSG